MIKSTLNTIKDKSDQVFRGFSRLAATGAIVGAGYLGWQGAEWVRDTKAGREFDYAVERSGINYHEKFADKLDLDREKSSDLLFPAFLASVGAFGLRKVLEEKGL